MSARRIVGTADVARTLGVTKQAISNHLARYSDTPPHRYVTADGRLFWDHADLARWTRWHAQVKRVKPNVT